MQNHIWQETKLEIARNFVPGWLSRAFFERLRSSCSPQSEADVCGLLLPRLDPAELVFLSLIIGDLQKQLIYADSKASCLTISVEMAKKHLSSFDRDHQERMIRVLESLSQLRFVVNGDGSQRDVLPLFSKESWMTDDSGRELVAVSLHLEEHTLEVLTGIVDLHADLARALAGNQTVRAVTCGLAPLMVWTPVWLELSWPERLLYMRMEMIMQAHGCWLRLDGLAGAPISELMQGVEILKKTARDKVAATGSQLLETLRLIGRLGRRLVAHGVLKKAPDDGYLATGVDLESPMLLWQASHERLRSKAEIDYVEVVGRCLLGRANSSQVECLLELFSRVSGDYATMRLRLGAVWEAIKNLPGARVWVGPGVVVQAHFLFIEWLARSNAKAVLGLPENVFCSQFSMFLEQVTTANAAQKFKGFCGVLAEKRSFSEFSGDSESALPVTLAFEGASQRLLDLRQCGPIIEPSRFDANTGAMEPVRAGASRVGPSDAASRTSENNQNPNGIHPKQEPNGVQKLQKLAFQELEKMIFQSPASYVDLKKRYMDTLDSETRSLLLNVQRRLDSRDFDRQLRTRLVRFMVDNPASWTSVNSTLPI